jgi:hypothetical protein
MNESLVRAPQKGGISEPPAGAEWIDLATHEPRPLRRGRRPPPAWASNAQDTP